jgi:hypothetical protein
VTLKNFAKSFVIPVKFTFQIGIPSRYYTPPGFIEPVSFASAFDLVMKQKTNVRNGKRKTNKIMRGKELPKEDCISMLESSSKECDSSV